MPLSGAVREIHRLAVAGRIGAIVMAEQAVDRHVAVFRRPDDRAIALDILLRDLARLRTFEPGLDDFVAQVECYIDLLHRELAHRAA